MISAIQTGLTPWAGRRFCRPALLQLCPAVAFAGANLGRRPIEPSVKGAYSAPAESRASLSPSHFAGTVPNSRKGEAVSHRPGPCPLAVRDCTSRCPRLCPLTARNGTSHCLGLYFPLPETMPPAAWGCALHNGGAFLKVGRPGGKKYCVPDCRRPVRSYKTAQNMS